MNDSRKKELLFEYKNRMPKMEVSRKNGLTQKNIADALGVSNKTVSKIEEIL